MKVPVPCLVAPNHRSQFDPHMVRRGVRGSLEMYACEIPEVDLTKFLVQPEYKQEVKAEMETPKVEAFKEEMKQEVQVFKCDQCPKEFNSSRAIRMHKMSGHKKEKVGV
jgi:hypothetical protein